MAGVKNAASSVKKKSSTVVQSEDENSLALVQAVQQDQDAPITSSYNDPIRPLLDTVDKLRHLMITREGIQLPTIVVVGDQSSGKSSQDEGIGLPNFLPRTAFLTILQKKVKGKSSIPISFAEKVWNYAEEVVISVIMQHSENYYQLQSSFRRAGLIAKMKERSVNWVMEIVEMEKLTDYTCNPEYLSDWNTLMSQQDAFMKDVLTNEERPAKIKLNSFGEIEVGKLRDYPHVLQQAFDMKMRITAYWKIVLKRLVDCMALHLLLSVGNLVNREFEIDIVNELMGPGGGIERMLEESTAVAAKRLKINKSVQLLKKSNEVVAKIMDKVGTYAN